MAGKYHTSVLLAEVSDLLQVKSGKKYIDATLGGGGHAAEIIRRGGIVLGIDIDLEAIAYVQENQKSNIKNQELISIQGNFGDIDKIAHLQGFDRVAGVIFDLGVSSRQINKGERGFSYQKEGPLDMRMNQDEKLKASDILNLATYDQLYKIFKDLGDEPRAWALAKAVVRAREIEAFETTNDLLKVIEKVYGFATFAGKARAKIATRAFQALRIAVNSELESLEIALPKALNLLEENGRLVVITFHSLEDRIVKQAFLSFQEQDLGNILTKKPIVPSSTEQEMNVRSRSAKLRVFEKS